MTVKDDFYSRVRRYGHLTKDECCIELDTLYKQLNTLAVALDNIETTALCRQELGGDKANADGLRRIGVIAGAALDAVVGAVRKAPETDGPPCQVCGKGPREGNHATDLGVGHDYVPKVGP